MMPSVLKEFVLDSWIERPTSIKYFISILLVILLGGVGYWALVESQFEYYDQLVDQRVSWQTALQRSQQQLSQLPTHQHQLQVIKKQWSTLLYQLPTQQERTTLLAALSKISAVNGLRIDELVSRPEVNHDFYLEWPIHMTLVGQYFQLAAFLSQVEQMNHQLTLHTFEVRRLPASKQHLLVMTITLKIYQSHLTGTRKFFKIKSLVPKIFSAQSKHGNPFSLNHGQEDLSTERFSSSSLKFVGLLKQGLRSWGLIKFSTGKVSLVQLGDFIEKSKKKVVYIGEESLRLEENVLVDGKMKKRQILLKLLLARS